MEEFHCYCSALLSYNSILTLRGVGAALFLGVGVVLGRRRRPWASASSLGVGVVLVRSRRHGSRAGWRSAASRITGGLEMDEEDEELEVSLGYDLQQARQ